MAQGITAELPGGADFAGLPRLGMVGGVWARGEEALRGAVMLKCAGVTAGVLSYRGVLVW